MEHRPTLILAALTEYHHGCIDTTRRRLCFPIGVGENGPVGVTFDVSSPSTLTETLALHRILARLAGQPGT